MYRHTKHFFEVFDRNEISKGTCRDVYYILSQAQSSFIYHQRRQPRWPCGMLCVFLGSLARYILIMHGSVSIFIKWTTPTRKCSLPVCTASSRPTRSLCCTRMSHQLQSFAKTQASTTPQKTQLWHSWEQLFFLSPEVQANYHTRHSQQ